MLTYLRKIRRSLINTGDIRKPASAAPAGIRVMNSDRAVTMAENLINQIKKEN